MVFYTRHYGICFFVVFTVAFAAILDTVSSKNLCHKLFVFVHKFLRVVRKQNFSECLYVGMSVRQTRKQLDVFY